MRSFMATSIAALIASTAFAQGAAMPAPPTSDPITFRAAGEDAPVLEGVLSIPRRPTARFQVTGVVICHPDPKMGGTMNNPVVLEIEERLLNLGIAVLRFNFRGTGESTGEHDGATAEADDVLGAVAVLRAQPAVDPDRIAVAGYSFGSLMALRAAARDASIVAAACIGFPTGEDLVRADDYLYLSDLSQPTLFVTGTDDQYSSIPNLMALDQHYGLAARVLPIEGANHFFSDAGKRSMMGIQVAQYLSMQLVGAF